MEKIKERVSILEVKVEGLKTDTAGFKERFNHMDAEFVSIHGKIADCRSSLEGKITETNRFIVELSVRLEGKITETNRFIAELSVRFESRISDLHGKISDLHKSITNQTRWMVGIMGSLTATMIAALITAIIRLS